MGIGLGSNFTVNVALPLDDRGVVATTVARDAIPAGVRYQGMTVFVSGDAKNWQLQGGITNADWKVAGGGGGVIVVANIAARDAIIAGDRYDGYLVYVTSERKLYQLQGAITNTDWVPLGPTTFAISVSTTLTKQHSNGIILVDATVAARTITLPPATNLRDMQVTIKKIDNSVNTVVIEGDASDQIDGELNYTIYDRYASITIIAHGGNWYRVE